MIHSHLAQFLVILGAAVVCVPLFERLRLGPVVGYLVAGIVIGPGGLALVHDIEAVQALGALGVVFLLFTIGLEFTRERLSLIGGRVLALAALQVVVTTAAIAGVALLGGFDGPQAIIIGSALALSSTAIVLPILAATGRLNTVTGRTAVAVTVIQDLAVGPILVLIETLGQSDGNLAHQLAIAVVKAALAIGVILLLGRLVLRPVFRIVAQAKSPEVFVGMALLVALGTSFGTEHAGLSMAFGGLLAGLLLAETEFRHQVAADVEPFRGLLLGLFFMTVGMVVDLRLVAENAGVVLGLAAALMLGKGLLLFVLAVLLGVPRLRAARLGGLLSQGGEVAFIAFGAAAAAGLFVMDTARLLIAIVAVSMMATPLVIGAGRWLIAWFDNRGIAAASDLAGDRLDIRDHVIIVGYGEVGRIVARMLKAYGIPYVVLDQKPETIREARAENEPIFFGNALNQEVLRGVGAHEALAVVVTTGSPGVAEGLATLHRHAFPNLQILVRGGGEQAILSLRKAGLTPVGQEATETGLKLTGALIDLWQARQEGPEGAQTAEAPP
jgi:monovalent cation:H+ antiporter-2, CPA2 family